MIELVQAIQKRGLTSIAAQYHLTTVRHKQYPNLVLLKYSQINSPMGELIVQQARGIILDEADDWRIVSYPYNKFFNYGEGHAPEIDWTSAKVYEKLDGSLMTLYWYDSQWQVASSGTPDGSGNVHACSMTFAELFWQVWKNLDYNLPNPEYGKELCYMFELLTPYNRVIVQSTDYRIVLHGVRELVSMKEYKPEIGRVVGWECVKTYDLNSWDSIVEAAKNLDPMVSEGYIVCDDTFNRVKVKSPQYVALANLKGGFGIRRMLEIIQTNEGDEFLTYFPEWREQYKEIKGKYEWLILEIEIEYKLISHIEVQKDFALIARHMQVPSILFGLRKGFIKSVREGLAEMPVRKLEELLGIQSDPIFVEQEKL